MLVRRGARNFATTDLGLPHNKSYTTYADIGRPYVVWNVVATPEFSRHPAPLVLPGGRLRGLSRLLPRTDGAHVRRQLRPPGYDVAIDGVPAYSTLGKFSDPVLSSMLRYDDDDVVATIFHELAHQLLYVKDDSAFNEAFATTVEDAGLERWLVHEGAPGRIEAFRTDEAHEAAFVKLLAGTRKQLAQLYASAEPPEAMRAGKQEVFAALAQQIRTLEKRDDLSGTLYDEWIGEGLNNARLASVATYYDCVPGFRRLLASEGNDLERFYGAARALARLPRAQRDAQLCGAAVEVDAAAD